MVFWIKLIFHKDILKLTDLYTLSIYRFRWQKNLATSDLPFQAFEGFMRTDCFSNPVRAFLENSLFVLFPAFILDLVDLGACYKYLFLLAHSYNAPKEYFWSKKNSNFMYRFIKAILAIFQFFQNGTFFEWHEI